MAIGLSALHVLFRQLFHRNGVANDMHERSFWGQFMSISVKLLAQMLGFLDIQLAMHNSMVALVELTDNCTLRHSARALYHCRSPYVPMLTALTLYHAICDGIAWTAGGLMLALVVGNVCINVFYKIIHQSFLLLGLPLPAPAIHCEILPEQHHVQAVPPVTTSRPTPILTYPLGATPLLGSETVRVHNTASTGEFHHPPHPLVQLFEQHNHYNNALTSTSSSNSSASSSTHSRYEYVINHAVNAGGYEYEEEEEEEVDAGDDNTASTMSTAIDNVQDVFGRDMQEICEKVEVCHDQ